MSGILSDTHLLGLKERLPDTPDTIVLKADVLREGVRYTQELGEIGAWAIPCGTFLSREDVPDSESTGSFISGLAVPNQMILEDDTRINLELDRGSPYTVRQDGETGYVLCRNDEPVAPLTFLPRPTFAQRLSDGSPIPPFLNQRAEGCAVTVHTLYCEYARTNEQCSFCVLGQDVADQNLIDVSVERLPKPMQAIEAFQLASQEIELEHIVISGGAFINTELEAKSYARTIAALRAAVGPDVRITAVCQAFDEAGWVLLKEAGCDRVSPNIEVWDDTLWPEVLPGKAKAIGKDVWIERTALAVDIFGKGEVATSFVAGAEIGSADFRSFDQVVDSHLEGYASLLQHDIVPIFGFLTKARNTRFEKVELPPTEFFLQLGWERTKLMEEFGMYDVYGEGVDADFSCYKCVTHKTCQDYPRLMQLTGSGPASTAS